MYKRYEGETLEFYTDIIINMTRKSREVILEELRSIQQTLHSDSDLRHGGELLVSEIMSINMQIRFPGRTAAACYLIVCRLREIPIRVTEIADASTATKTEILDEMQRISDALSLGIPNDDPAVILEKACRNLGLSTDVEARAHQIEQLGAEAGVSSGVSPYTYAAAVLYVASSAADSGLSQVDIADQFDVSTATLRNRRDDLLEATGSDLFELQFSTAPLEAISLVDDLLHHAQTAHWARGKRQMGVLAGAWLYAVNKYQIEVSVSELSAITGVSDSTIRARYEEFVEDVGTPDNNTTA